MPSTSAARMRLLRERRRSGIIMAQVQINAAARQDLVSLGWLRQQAPAGEVVAALVQLVECAFDARLQPRP